MGTFLFLERLLGFFLGSLRRQSPEAETLTRKRSGDSDEEEILAPIFFYSKSASGFFSEFNSFSIKLFGQAAFAFVFFLEC